MTAVQWLCGGGDVTVFSQSFVSDMYILLFDDELELKDVASLK